MSISKEETPGGYVRAVILVLNQLVLTPELYIEQLESGEIIANY